MVTSPFQPQRFTRVGPAAAVSCEPENLNFGEGCVESMSTCHHYDLVLQDIILVCFFQPMDNMPRQETITDPCKSHHWRGGGAQGEGLWGLSPPLHPSPPLFPPNGGKISRFDCVFLKYWIAVKCCCSSPVKSEISYGSFEGRRPCCGVL